MYYHYKGKMERERDEKRKRIRKIMMKKMIRMKRKNCWKKQEEIRMRKEREDEDKKRDHHLDKRWSPGRDIWTSLSYFSVFFSFLNSSILKMMIMMRKKEMKIKVDCKVMSSERRERERDWTINLNFWLTKKSSLFYPGQYHHYRNGVHTIGESEWEREREKMIKE